MAIGIVDCDALTSPQNFIPSLDLMKISGYLKGKKKVVHFLTSSKNLERFEKVIFFKDKRDGINPESYMNLKNVEFWGRAFFGGVQCALPEEVERAPADIGLYVRYMAKERPLKARQVEVADHIRLFSELKWPTKELSDKIYVYDELRDILNSPAAINWLLEKREAHYISLCYRANLETRQEYENYCLLRNKINLPPPLFSLIKGEKELFEAAVKTEPKIIARERIEVPGSQDYYRNIFGIILENCLAIKNKGITVGLYFQQEDNLARPYSSIFRRMSSWARSKDDVPVVDALKQELLIDSFGFFIENPRIYKNINTRPSEYKGE